MALVIPRFSTNLQLLAASENKPPLHQGAKGEGVAILQQALVDLGFNMAKTTAGGTRPPDGIYGQETFATVRAFQSANCLKADGIAGRHTLSRLEQMITARYEIDLAEYRAEVRRIQPFA
jgi:peptidoglycan hydrolase-like protein with peptidoglycan-binding domain